MNVNEIKQAVNDGKTVHWANTCYEVRVNLRDQWLILCTDNGVDLTLLKKDGVTLNGMSENQFFIYDPN